MKKLKLAIACAVSSIATGAMAVPTPATYAMNGGFAMSSGTNMNSPVTNATGYNATNGTNYGNVVSFTGTSGPNVLVSAFGSTGSFVAGGTTGYDRAIQTAFIAQYGSLGLGVTSRPTQGNAAPSASTGYVGASPNNNELVDGSGNVTMCTTGATACYDNANAPTPQHTLDNAGAYESLLLNFQAAVKLTSVSIGYPSSTSSIDSDATVLEYNGAGQACGSTPTLVGLSYQQLVTKNTAVAGSGCWTIAANLLNLAQAPGQTESFNSGSTAQYWLVGAYMDIGSNVGKNNTFGNDAIKISAVGVNKVPEPGSIALFGIAGAAFLARRRKARVA